MKYSIDVNDNLKKIKKYSKFIELTEKYFEECKQNDCDSCIPYNTNLQDLKSKREILIKQMICDHKNTYEEEWTNGHNGDRDIVTICRDCEFIVEKN